VAAPTTGSAARGDDVALALPAVARPELLALAVAAGAGGQGWPTFLGAALAVVVGVLAGRAGAALPAGLGAWLVRVVAVVALGCGVALVVDGVYAV